MKLLIGAIDVAENADNAITSFGQGDYFNCGADIGKIVYAVQEAIAKKK